MAACNAASPKFNLSKPGNYDMIITRDSEETGDRAAQRRSLPLLLCANLCFASLPQEGDTILTRSFASRSSRITFAALAASCGFTALHRPALAQQVAPAAPILPGHIARVVDVSQPLGALEDAAPVRLAITLPLRNQAQLNALLTRLYDPLDPLYGRFLTSMEFTAQFAPTEADYAAVRRFAEESGLKVVGTHANRLVLDVQGTSAEVGAAFAVALQKYRSPQGLIFHSPDREPSLPPSLIGKVQAIVGLDSAGVLHPHNVRGPIGPLATAHAGSGPNGGFSPADIKTAYNLNSVSETGSGQTLGLYELDGYTKSDITKYEQQFSLTATPLQNVLVDGVTGSAGSGAGEVTLDIELMIALAPAATKIVVYEGPNSVAGAVDTYNKIATDNVAKAISTSWGLSEANNSAASRSSENTIFQQMAAQGQSIYAAAGDSGAYDNGSSLSVDDPASQPYMVGVGGARLTTNGAGGAYSSETTWNGGSVSAGGGGGGISIEWAIPSYQSGVVSGASLGSTSQRNVPDVSLNADPNTGYAIYYGNAWQTYGGTSCAAPLWAAFTGLVNQRARCQWQRPARLPEPRPLYDWQGNALLQRLPRHFGRQHEPEISGGRGLRRRDRMGNVQRREPADRPCGQRRNRRDGSRRSDQSIRDGGQRADYAFVDGLQRRDFLQSLPLQFHRNGNRLQNRSDRDLADRRRTDKRNRVFL